MVSLESNSTITFNDKHLIVRYMIFFQLPVIPEKVLTAFGASLFQWLFQRPGLTEQENKAYLDLYQDWSKSISLRSYSLWPFLPVGLSKPGRL